MSRRPSMPMRHQLHRLSCAPSSPRSTAVPGFLGDYGEPIGTRETRESMSPRARGGDAVGHPPGGPPGAGATAAPRARTLPHGLVAKAGSVHPQPCSRCATPARRSATRSNDAGTSPASPSPSYRPPPAQTSIISTPRPRLHWRETFALHVHGNPAPGRPGTGFAVARSPSVEAPAGDLGATCYCRLRASTPTGWRGRCFEKSMKPTSSPTSTDCPEC